MIIEQREKLGNAMNFKEILRELLSCIYNLFSQLRITYDFFFKCADVIFKLNWRLPQNLLIYVFDVVQFIARFSLSYVDVLLWVIKGLHSMLENFINGYKFAIQTYSGVLFVFGFLNSRMAEN